MGNRLILLVLILIAYPVLADEDTFTFSGSRISINNAEGSERTLLSGDAVIHSGNTKITADEIELFGTDYRYAKCKGNIKVVDNEKGIVLVCNTLFYDRDEEISRVEGYGEMVDLKNELVVRGGFFENFGKEDYTIIQIGVRIVQVSDEQEMICRSEFARYNREKEVLELSGMPVVHKEDDVFEASRITINLKTDEISLDGNVSGNIISTRDQSTISDENIDIEEENPEDIDDE